MTLGNKKLVGLNFLEKAPGIWPCMHVLSKAHVSRSNKDPDTYLSTRSIFPTDTISNVSSNNANNSGTTVGSDKIESTFERIFSPGGGDMQ